MNTDAPIRPQQKCWPKRLPRDLVIPETTLWFNLEVSATRFPDKPLYLFFGRPMTFSQAKAQAEALAGWLQSVGVKAGARPEESGVTVDVDLSRRLKLQSQVDGDGSSSVGVGFEWEY